MSPVSSSTAFSIEEDWENLAQAFIRYGELVNDIVVNSASKNDTKKIEDGPLMEFRLIATEIVELAEEKDYGHYFEDLKLTKYQEEEITRISEEFATICRKMHKYVMQNADNQIFRCLDKIWIATNEINEGDNKYTFGTHEETVTKTVDGETYTHTESVASDLQYYFDNEDTGLGELYNEFEKVRIEELEKYKPEGYKDMIKGLKSNETSLYVGSIGAYNKKLAEGDWKNYVEEIAIGVAIVATLAVVILTAGVAVPAIMGAVGLGGFATTSVVGGVVTLGYTGAVGLGVGAAVGAAGYAANTKLGEDGFAMDGTHLSEESKSDMFNRYVTNCAKAGMQTGIAVGTFGLVEMAIDGYDLVKAHMANDKVGIGVGWASLFIAGSGTIKTVAKTQGLLDGAKGLNNLDATTDIKSLGKFGDKATMMKHFKDTDHYNSYTAMLRNTKPKNSPTPETWFKKGGEIEIMENGDWVYTIKIDDIDYSIKYVDGLPQFPDECLHPDINPRQDIGKLTGSREKDFDLANAKAGLEEGTPKGYSWHHDMPCGKMVLVKTEIHKLFTHKGGFSLCK